MKQEKTFRIGEITRRVTLSSQKAIEIAGQVLTPDLTRAYADCVLSRAFPMVTADNCALHPQVVANSYPSMLHKVFDLGHLLVAYDPQENPRDRMLGTVVAVEFPATPEGGWKVQANRSAAPAIRAAAVIHRQLEDAEEIIQMQVQGDRKWAVSMENRHYPESGGFAIAGRRGVEQWEESTPDDLRKMGFIYVPHSDAPDSLRETFDEDASKVTGDFQKQEVIFFQGGLNGQIHYMGIGLTPLGKEEGARVTQMLASGISFSGLEDLDVPGVLQLLRAPLRLLIE